MESPTELSQEQIDQFVVAAHHDLAAVKDMLAAQPQLLNENAEWVETAIQAAAHVGSREIAEYLLAQGAPLDICTAAVLGRAEDVAALLAESPELAGATGSHNIPVLYYAAIGGYTEIAQMLIDAGADINAGAGGNTALHGAAGFGRVEMVRWLLDRGANPYEYDHEGRMPLDVAVATGHEQIAEMLRQASGLE